VLSYSFTDGNPLGTLNPTDSSVNAIVIDVGTDSNGAIDTWDLGFCNNPPITLCLSTANYVDPIHGLIVGDIDQSDTSPPPPIFEAGQAVSNVAGAWVCTQQKATQAAVPCTIPTTPTPEPGTCGLTMFGIGLLLVMRKRIAQPKYANDANG
jgi:hypothetical protein